MIIKDHEKILKGTNRNSGGLEVVKMGQGWNSEQRCKSSKVLDLKMVKSSQRKYKYVLKYTYFEV